MHTSSLTRFLKIFSQIRRTVLSVLLVSIVAVSGCSSNKDVSLASDAYIQQQRDVEARNNVELLNREITSASGQVESEAASWEYYLGPGDVIDIAVFQVEDLSKTVRINGRGTVILPMLGETKVEGLTVTQAEKILSDHLRDFLHEPQVSVFVAEHRSQEISVLGAVRSPGIKSVTKTRTL